jgi:hypothetical protein
MKLFRRYKGDKTEVEKLLLGTGRITYRYMSEEILENDMIWEPKFFVGFMTFIFLWGVAIGVVAMLQ